MNYWTLDCHVNTQRETWCQNKVDFGTHQNKIIQESNELFAFRTTREDAFHMVKDYQMFAKSLFVGLANPLYKCLLGVTRRNPKVKFIR